MDIISYALCKKIATVKGEPGFSPTITENADNTDKIYKLDITTADSTFTTPNLKGADGQGGTGGGEANIIDSISVNGVNVAPDENKNVDIEIPSIEGLATETYVDNKIADYTKTADLADVAKSGNYEDLSNKPTIPTVTDEYNAESSEAASGKAINQAMSTLKGLPKPYFVFVDDDGKENFKTLYTDILQPRGIVGGLSIVFSSYTIDANKYLTQNEINEYSNLGWDILCHSTDLNSLTIDTADAVLNYCDNRIAHYGFKKSNIFVYPNGNEGDNKIAIEEKVAKHFKYAFNINYSHNCPANIPLQNRMDIGRIVIPRASEITAEIKAYYKNLIDKTINENKLMIISTHSDKSDYTYLTELLDYILNQGYSFTSPVKALSEIDEYRFQNKLIPGDNISITPDNIISASFTESDPTVPSHVKSITVKNISDWNNKSDFSGSYNDLIDTPAIPSIEGLAKTEDIPTKVSDLENDSKYQTESDVTTILTDYATKTYVGEQIANAEHLKREIVTVLPSDEEASDNIIYMLKIESTTGNDKYQEYMKIDGTVQMVGDASVDLTDYAKTADIPTTLPADGGNSNTVNNHTVESDVPTDAVFTDTIYDDTEVKRSIDELSSNLDTLEFGENAGGKNLFNKETAHIGKVILFSSGEMITNADYFCTDYIPVIPNTTYVRSAFTTLGENWYYDIDKNPLNSIQENENIFTTPENAYYVRLSGGVPNVDIAQLEEGSVATEYEPYIPSVKMLAEEKADKSETTVNLLKSKLQTTTNNGITCTYNGDGTYTLNGTAVSTTYFRIQGITALAQRTTNKTYKMVGCPTGGINKYDLRYEINGSIANGGGKDFGDGVIIKNDKINSTDITSAEIIIAVMKDIIVNNLVFKPMLTTNLDATYDDFVPYTGDTGKLNSDVANIKNDLNNYALKSLYGNTTINVGRLANSAVGNCSTAEGRNTTASGNNSHAEGDNTTASGESSHAEGKGTTASAAYAHSEGVNTSAIGQGSHAEGSNLDQNRYNEIVFEDPREVAIDDTMTGEFATITVVGSQAFGLNSHAEGCATLAYGRNSHTEGYHTVTVANESHAEGSGTEANGGFSHAEGFGTKAKGSGAHAEGYSATASGMVSHAEGRNTTASGMYSHAEGNGTTASNYASHASGKYNAAMTTGGGSTNTTGTAFVIGNGTGDSALSNAFSVQFNGTVKAQSTITASTTADYAEFFEWLDKNPNEEDRVGHFVTLDGDKIKIATSEDDYILGIVSGEPFVLGNGDCDTWNGMYLHDEFRRTMYEPAPKMIEILDSEGNPTGEYEEVEGEFEGTRPILNPDYDPTQEYVSRFDRTEWSPVGMLGVLAVLHDGTAEVNGYITVNNQGIATKCTRDTRNSYRVIKKVSDKVVEVIFR